MAYQALHLKSKEPFRLLITGSREWDDPEHIWWALSKIDVKLGPRTGILVHGAARGADRMAAAHWESLNNRNLTLGPRLLEPHPVHDLDYEQWGKGAPIRRNMKMVDKGANLCLAFILNRSPGASNCAKYAREKGIRVIRFEH